MGQEKKLVVEKGTLAEGAVLTVTYKKAEHRCTVIKTEKGLEFQLADGKTFGSPSSAGKAITGRVSCDGWKFWSIAEGAMPAPAQSEAVAETAEKPKREPKTAGPKMIRNIRKMPNQKGVAEGSTKWWCSACMKGFITESAELPQACPESHPLEQADQFAVPAEDAAAE
jgi:Zn finger protein HypA/HybF involved in hydrogenase expression